MVRPHGLRGSDNGIETFAKPVERPGEAGDAHGQQKQQGIHPERIVHRKPEAARSVTRCNFK